MNTLDYIDLLPANGQADACVVWLHGLGARADDFVAIVDQLGLGSDHRIRFVFPNAPVRSITVNDGLLMQAWYDIYQLNLLDKEDESGIKSSCQQLVDLLIAQVDSGIPMNRIVLVGFSQGGALALYTGLRLNMSLAGIVGLSTYQPLSIKLGQERCAANQSTPIMLTHGLFDPVVPFKHGQFAFQQLQTFEYPVQWYSYPMSHTVSAPEITDIGVFLKRVLQVSD